jgi:hypothetical protein
MIKNGQISEEDTPPDDAEPTKKASPKALEDHPTRRLEQAATDQRREAAERK